MEVDSITTFIEAKEMYESGLSLREIERRTGYNRKKLSSELKELGVLHNYHNKSSQIFSCSYEEDIHYEIVNLYLSGMSMKQISLEIDISTSIINRVLVYHKVHTKRIYRKYKVDENVFEKIDNENAAYWLGFLYADGYIRKDSNGIELCIAQKDKDHLIRFKHFMKTNSPITKKTIKLNDKEYEAVRICINSKKIANDLISLGCTNNKSLTLVFPNFIEEEYINHFMRGYFDGDGSFIYSKSKETHTPIYTFNLLGTNEFLKGFNDELPLDEKYISFDVRHLSNHGKAKSLVYHGNNVVSSIACFLYKNSQTFLPRKYEIIADLL